ncbi:MAG: hypothetical protein NE334_09490 [Lentisphaeraceae bacterium]|nr:hypothetical protein [Lentisphaeraceae bacterium]
MNIKSYILPEKDVGALAQSVAIQQRKISLIKDKESSFYIAHVDAETIIPKSIQILEIQVSETTGLPELNEADPNGVDLLLRLQFDKQVEKEKLPEIYEHLTKAIDKALKEIQP